MLNIWWEKLQAKKASKGSVITLPDNNLITLADTVRVIWTAETKWNQIVTENPNKNV